MVTRLTGSAKLNSKRLLRRLTAFAKARSGAAKRSSQQASVQTMQKRRMRRRILKEKKQRNRNRSRSRKQPQSKRMPSQPQQTTKRKRRRSGEKDCMLGTCVTIEVLPATCLYLQRLGSNFLLPAGVLRSVVPKRNQEVV